MNKSDYIQQNLKAYDSIARPFDQTRKILWDDLLPLKHYTKNGDKVLDIGCGSGRLYHLFDDLSIDYTGVDQSKEQLKFAKKNYPNAKFVVAEMTELPFEEDSFDVIYCIATLHHLPTHKLRLQALKEMKRVLKKNGQVILTNWNLDSSWAEGKMSAQGGSVSGGKQGVWQKEGEDHFLIPFQTGDKKVHGVRHYWKLEFEYLKELFEEAEFTLEEHYYSTRGKKNDIKGGDNIVSVLISD